jgi:hypothetical protein
MIYVDDAIAAARMIGSDDRCASVESRIPSAHPLRTTPDRACGPRQVRWWRFSNLSVLFMVAVYIGETPCDAYVILGAAFANADASVCPRLLRSNPEGQSIHLTGP